ncbi:BON domain-containing protein [Streptomyces sp. NPDC014861]|uniref:BON domain-containing protein n=1 Tax=Streptomyces sp. NPDC014861 TaxID=3364923 RepID=UPI0036FA8EDB
MTPPTEPEPYTTPSTGSEPYTTPSTEPEPSTTSSTRSGPHATSAPSRPDPQAAPASGPERRPGGRAPDPEPYTDDYLIALLRERLAVGGQAELGVRVERRGGVILLTGTVPNAARRDEILDLARSTLTGRAVRAEMAVAGRDAPDHGEDLP